MRRFLRQLHDLGFAFVTGFGFILAGWIAVGVKPVVPVFAQAFGNEPRSLSSESLMEFAIRQGGAFAVLVLVLYFYRRDYRDLNDYRKDRDAILVQIVTDSTKAQTEMAAALAQNNIVVHQTKNVIRDLLPHRRIDDSGE